MCGNIWCILDWNIRFCHKTAEIHFVDISCSTFSLFTFHLENSFLSAHVKVSLENNCSNFLVSIGVVIKITFYIYSMKFNFIKTLFSVCILVYCSLPTTNWLRSGNQVVWYRQNSPMMHCAECKKIPYPIWPIIFVSRSFESRYSHDALRWMLKITYPIWSTIFLHVLLNPDKKFS